MVLTRLAVLIILCRIVLRENLLRGDLHSTAGGYLDRNFPKLLRNQSLLMTSTAKSFFGLLLGMIVFVAGIMYLIAYQERIAMILGTCLGVIVGCFLLYVIFAPIFNSLSERASNILAIYPDVSERGLHIFSAFTISRIKVGLSPLRSIQYYFLVTATHKLYYKVLLTHSMESASGHSGYVDFSSFEENILDGPEFKDALQSYSIKAGWPLQLGHAVREGEDETFDTQLGDLAFKIETFKGLIQDTLQICCYDTNGKLQWRKKL